MALISCPECKKQISSQAKSCPNCGYPLDNLEKSLQITRPELSSDLSIGKQVVNWGGDAAIKGYFDSQFNTDRSIPDGVGSLLLFKNGIKVTGKFYTPLIDIHFSQIVNIAVVQKDKILDTNNSVLARAAVGTILLGPLGGVIGGMSGIGRKKNYKSSVVVNYWDVKSDSLYSLVLFVVADSLGSKFCKRVQETISDK